MEPKNSRPILCPSAQPWMAGSRAFGVVGGTEAERRVNWIEEPVPVTEELLALTGSVPATQVLRIAAPCQESACCHFDGADCRLATKLVQLMPAVAESLPPCRIRRDCRWFVQEGRAACLRCPQIVTYSVNPTRELSIAATP
ncbi:MAG TPA: hypothetical protein VMT15_12390 [Bryobacteraceae bacterium]|nr:hypothetical protein [Bryobacteraceae bacterium]